MTAVYAWTTRDVVTVTGPDAATYLQGQLSQDVAGLPVGECAWSFVLAPQGKVDGWGRVLRSGPEAFAIDVDPGAGTAWEARLRRFLLRTKAEIAVTASVPTVAVRGSTAFGGLPTPGITVGSDLIGAVPPTLPAEVPAEATEVTPAVIEALRIRDGVPRWGAELDADTIPATVGQWVIDASVSFTKGCYTGQELVARIDSRGGHVPRRLAGLVIDGPAPAPGAQVSVGGDVTGTVTSSATEGIVSVALTFVPRSVEIAPDGVAATVDGAPATLRLLPLPASSTLR